MTATTTCSRCLDGRHAHCTLKTCCACTICGAGTSWSSPTSRRAPSAPGSSTRRRSPNRRILRPGVGRGNNPDGWTIPAGSSTLPKPAQRIAEIMFTNGAGESEVANALTRSGACQRATRDQVRTIRLRLAGMTHGDRRKAARAA